MEEIGELIRKGFGIWRSNLSLCKPFLYSIVAMAFSIIAMAFVAIPLLVLTEAYKYNGYSDQEALLILIPFLAAIFFSLLIRLFFNLGAIGMARQVLERGRSDTSSMWSTARRHFRNMFLLSLLNGLIIGLAMLVGSILILGVQLAGAVPEISDPFDGTGMLLFTAIWSFFIVFVYILMFVMLFAYLQATLIFSTPVSSFALILSVVLSPAPYALVLEGLGPVQAIRAGVDFFRGNKFDVLVLCLVTTALRMIPVLSLMPALILLILAMGWLYNFSSNEGALSIVLLLAAILADLLVLAPLTNLWWTRLYMVRKGMLNSEEVKDPQ